MMEDKIAYSSLKIEDIKGIISYDPIPKFKETAQGVKKNIRRLGIELQKKQGWESSLTTEDKELLGSTEIQELAIKGGDAAKVAAALALGREHQGDEFWKLVAKCDNPQFTFEVASEKTSFNFDSVQHPSQVKETLERFFDTIVNGFELEEIQKFGIQFRHIFRLKPTTKNYEWMSESLLPGMTRSSGAYTFLGKDCVFKRSDISFLFLRDQGNLITKVDVEAPGNEDNSTIWISVDTQTRGEILEVSQLQDLAPHFYYYQNFVTNLLDNTLSPDILDTTRREMITDDWLKKR